MTTYLDAIRSLIAATNRADACAAICDRIADASESIADTFSNDTLAILTELPTADDLDDELALRLFAAAMTAFSDPAAATHAAHIRDTMRDNADLSF